MTTDTVPILRVSDAAAASAWYRRLGFEQVFEHRFEPHLPAYVGLRREGAQIHVSEHTGDAQPNGLVYVWVDDIDEIAAEFGVAVDDQPWAREVQLVDPDGNRLRVAQPVGSASTDDVLGDGATVELIELERAMWADATRGDHVWMNRHLADGFTEFGWSGRIYSRSDVLDEEIGPIDAELTDLQVRAVGPDAALVTYRSSQERGAGNRCSLWVRRRRRWLLEFHQGTPTPR
jgi:hypothetical protein